MEYTAQNMQRKAKTIRRISHYVFIHGRWQMPETSAVACLNINITLSYCRSIYFPVMHQRGILCH
ncbi:hypothetical protein FDW96_20240 [Citrobacter sp. TBCS-15]|nr:hypothetical protein FDW96_20240 [Citrobacter sp. TBCS-15]TKU73609.1 hypothetical protein FDW92_16470 [Citrobacter sp. wls706]TKU75670.1 hypothetical protein FDX14_06575 [Citrobacter sp. wls710]